MLVYALVALAAVAVSVLLSVGLFLSTVGDVLACEDSRDDPEG